MVAAFDYCLHGKGGAAPSIDTAMHGLVDAAHVDHLHPDSGIALATAADGEELTRQCFGDRVVWVPWRRPGIPARVWTSRRSSRRTRRRSAASSAGTASPPGATTSEECEANSLEIIRTAEKFLADNGSAEPFGAVVAGLRGRCPRRSGTPRRPRSAPTIRGLASTDRPQVGHYTDSRRGAGLPVPGEARRAGRAGHVVPGSLPAHQGQAAGGGPARRRAGART